MSVIVFIVFAHEQMLFLIYYNYNYYVIHVLSVMGVDFFCYFPNTQRNDCRGNLLLFSIRKLKNRLFLFLALLKEGTISERSFDYFEKLFIFVLLLYLRYQSINKYRQFFL